MTDHDVTLALHASLVKAEAELRDRGAAMAASELRELLFYIELLRDHLRNLNACGTLRARKLFEWRMRGATGPLLIEGGKTSLRRGARPRGRPRHQGSGRRT